MRKEVGMKSLFVKTAGGLILAGSISAIWLLPVSGKNGIDEPQPVRPVRSEVVRTAIRIPRLSYPGIVRASDSVDLAFEVSGRLVNFPAGSGRKVRKGEVLAVLDTRDFMQDLNKAKAAAEQARLTEQRNITAAKKHAGAVSQEQISVATANRIRAEAELKIAEKAVEDAVLKAPYDGWIADTYPSTYDTVEAGQKILTLQNIETVKVDVSLPESLVIDGLNTPFKSRKHYITFDSLPAMKYVPHSREFKAHADSRTQTYTATFAMKRPERLRLLPGMSATLTVEGCDMPSGDAKPWVSSDSVGNASDGSAFVWKLEPSGKEGEFTVKKRMVKLGRRVGSQIEVVEGLADGDRIASAGINILSEGRKVVLYKE